MQTFVQHEFDWQFYSDLRLVLLHTKFSTFQITQGPVYHDYDETNSI